MTESRFNVDKVVETIKEEVRDILSQLGQEAASIQSQMDQFFETIRPDIQEAIMANDMLSVNLIRDRIASKLGAISIGVMHNTRMVVLGVITAVLRTVVRIAVGAL